MVLAVDMVLTVTGHNEHVALFQGAVALGTPDECQVWSLCDSLYVIQFSFIKIYCVFLLCSKGWMGRGQTGAVSFHKRKKPSRIKSLEEIKGTPPQWDVTEQTC